MKKLLLALALAVLPAARLLAQDEVTDIIYEVNDPPANLMTIWENGAAVGSETVLDFTTGGGICSDVSGTKILCNLGGLGGGAPTTAKYITQTPDGTLSAEQALSLLGTGLLLNTTTTGVLSQYAGAPCTNQFIRSLDSSGAATCNSIVNADITASTIDLTTKVTGKLPLANMADGAAISVRGRSANSTGVVADIQCTAASGNVVRESGSALGCTALPVTAPVVNTTGTLSLAVTPANPGGAIALQASAPGTVQSTAFSNIDGLSTVTKANILLVRTPAFFASNTTASDAVNTVQLAPSFQSCGSGWNSTSVAAETDCVRLTLKPIVGNPTTMTLGFDFSTNGGAYVTDRVLIAQNGSIQTQGNITGIGATGNFTVPANGNGKFLFNSHGGLNDTGADGKFDLETTGGTIASYTSGVVTASSLAAGIFQVQAGNGALCQYGSSTEAITLATGATLTDSTNTLLPANSIIDGFVFRVTASITTATTIQFGDDTPQVARFSGALTATPCGAANIAINATGMCTQIFDQSNATLALGTANQTGRKVRITTNVNPGAGIVRVTVFWHVLTPPTS